MCGVLFTLSPFTDRFILCEILHITYPLVIELSSLYVRCNIQETPLALLIVNEDMFTPVLLAPRHLNLASLFARFCIMKLVTYKVSFNSL